MPLSARLQRVLETTRPPALHTCAEAAAGAWLAREPLQPAEAQVLRQLWPSLVAFTVTIAPEASSMGWCPEESQDLQLYCRECRDACCAVTLPLPPQPGLPQGSCTFQLAEPAPHPITVAELQHLVATMQASIAHQSKNIMEVRGPWFLFLGHGGSAGN